MQNTARVCSAILCLNYTSERDQLSVWTAAKRKSNIDHCYSRSQIKRVMQVIVKLVWFFLLLLFWFVKIICSFCLIMPSFSPSSFMTIHSRASWQYGYRKIIKLPPLCSWHAPHAVYWCSSWPCATSVADGTSAFSAVLFPGRFPSLRATVMPAHPCILEIKS